MSIKAPKEKRERQDQGLKCLWRNLVALEGVYKLEEDCRAVHNPSSQSNHLQLRQVRIILDFVMFGGLYFGCLEVLFYVQVSWQLEDSHKLKLVGMTTLSQRI